MDFFLWMVSIVLIVAGIYFLLRRKWLIGRRGTRRRARSSVRIGAQLRSANRCLTRA